MRVFLLLSGLLLVVPAFSQAPQPNNLSNAVARRQRDRESGRYQVRQDSLERLFYAKPPYVVVFYYQNARQLPWSAAMQLYLQKGSQRLVLQPDSGSRYLLPALGGDSLILGVIYRSRNIAFSKEPAWRFTHGATVTFGRFNRAYLNRGYRKQLADGDYSPPLEALQAIDSVRVARWRQTKRVRGAKYAIICPRVYGDGVVHTTYAPLLR